MEKIILTIFVLFSTLWAKPYTDMMGRTVEVSATSKLVFIGPGALRLGVYLGLHERLVGIEKTENDASALSPYRTFLGKERIAKLPLIGTGGPGKMPDLEALMMVKPDLIVASFVDKNQLELISSQTGIPIIALSYGATYGGNAKQLQSIKDSLLLLGNITQTTSRAQALVSFITAQEQQLSTIKLASQKIYIGGVGYKGAQGMTSTEASYPPFEMLGLKNSLFEGKETVGHQFIELEALLKNNPDMIFIDKFGKEKVNEEYATHKALFDTLNAYQKGNVKEVLNYNFYSTNVENLLIIAWQIATTMGESVDVNQKATEIFTAFYGTEGTALLEKLPYGLKTR